MYNVSEAFLKNADHVRGYYREVKFDFSSVSDPFCRNISVIFD